MSGTAVAAQEDLNRSNRSEPSQPGLAPRISLRAQRNAPPDFAVRRSPGSCEKLSSLRLYSCPGTDPASEAPVRHPPSTVFSTVLRELRNAITSWLSPSRALPSPSAWPPALLSSLPPKTSLQPLSLPAQPSWPVQPWQVLLSSLPASPRPLQPASWLVLLWPWLVLLSSLPALPRLSRPASWPALLLPWPRRPSAWQQVLLSSQLLRPFPPQLLLVLSLPVPSLPETWMPALWMTV